MCTVYENSSENDSKEAKAEQLKSILDLLEKCGVSQSSLLDIDCSYITNVKLN